MRIDQARNEIEDLILTPGEYGHNIVSLILRVVSEEHGYKEANKIVKELELSRIFGINKCWPAIKLLKNKKTDHKDDFKYKDLSLETKLI